MSAECQVPSVKDSTPHSASPPRCEHTRQPHHRRGTRRWHKHQLTCPRPGPPHGAGPGEEAEVDAQAVLPGGQRAAGEVRAVRVRIRAAVDRSSPVYAAEAIQMDEGRPDETRPERLVAGKLKANRRSNVERDVERVDSVPRAAPTRHRAAEDRDGARRRAPRHRTAGQRTLLRRRGVPAEPVGTDRLIERVKVHGALGARRPVGRGRGDRAVARNIRHLPIGGSRSSARDGQTDNAKTTLHGFLPAPLAPHTRGAITLHVQHTTARPGRKPVPPDLM